MVTQLTSPGVDIELTDDSAYASAGQGTIPLIVIGTHANKTLPGGTGIAPGTLPANANTLYPITSQRELLQTFGNPVFYTQSGAQVHGYELNEFGLFAAYTYLGIANQAYVIRGDIDYAQLVPQSTAPVGNPINGSEWIDGTTNTWNIYEYQSGSWNLAPITLIDNSANLESDTRVPGLKRPKSTAGGGTVGNFAMVVYGDAKIALYQRLVADNTDQNPWFLVGSPGWQTQKVVAFNLGVNTPSFVQGLGRPATGNQGDVLLLTSPNTSTTASTAANWKLKIYDAGTTTWNVYNLPVRKDGDALPSYAAIGFVFSKLDAPITTGVSPSQVTFQAASFTISSYVSNDPNTQQPVIADFTSLTISNTAPSSAPADGTLWYNPTLSATVMVGDGQQWQSYLTQYPNTNPNGVILSGSAPVTQDDGTPLVANDLWLDTSDLENYPKLYTYSAQAQWVLIDNTNDYDPVNGIVFGEESNTSALNYDAGMKFFDLTQSTYLVKEYSSATSQWTVASGRDLNGVPYFGRKAQRAMIVQALAATLSGNDQIRAETVSFNLIAAPGYVELIDEMVTLNTDKKQTAFIVGDTPSRLAPTGIAIQNFTNPTSTGAVGNTETSLTTADPYVGVYYPWGLSTNVDGSTVFVPPSAIALRTLAYNDSVAYPWLAPAGYTRGLVTNASSVGWLGSDGNFNAAMLNEGQRNILYQNNINPIAFIPNRGLVIYGQKTRNNQGTSLDRINVARLVNYLRVNLDTSAKPFLFEPNDQHTRDSIQSVFTRLLGNLVGLRGLYDYIVVCDESNNTPDRIDRNELWVDVAIQPVEAVEFIYIPMRLVPTGTDMAALYSTSNQ